MSRPATPKPRTPRHPPAPVSARPARAHPALIGVGLVYITVLAAMVGFNRYGFIAKSLIVPVLLMAALLTGHFRRFVNDWAVFLGAVVFFDFCRGLAFAVTTHFELPMYLGYVLTWERWLCGGAVAPVSLQHMRASLTDPVWLDTLLLLVYSSHYVFFLLFGFVLWQRRPDAFRTYTVALAAVMYGGLLFYFVVPTIPPWAAANDFLVLPPIEHIVHSFYNVHLPELLAAFDVNPIAAMPSLHVALPAMCTLLALRYLPRLGLLLLAYTATVCVAVIYLGEHYLVDVVAGWLLALAVFAGVCLWGAGSGRAASRNSEPPERWQLWPIGSALLLAAVTVGCGHLSAGWVGPVPITRAFVTRELTGRSILAHYYLGRVALAEGEVVQAQAELTRALDDLPAPEQQQVIRTLLASLKH